MVTGKTLTGMCNSQLRMGNAADGRARTSIETLTPAKLAVGQSSAVVIARAMGRPSVPSTT